MTARCVECGYYISFGGRGERLKLMRHCGKEPERLIAAGINNGGGLYKSVKTEIIYYLQNGVFHENPK